MLSCVLVFVCSNQVDILLLRFGNEVAGVEDLGTTGRGGDMQVSVLCVVSWGVVGLREDPVEVSETCVCASMHTYLCVYKQEYILLTDWHLCGKNVQIRTFRKCHW